MANKKIYKNRLSLPIFDNKGIGNGNGIAYVPNIIRGGSAIPIGNNMFFMKGKSHSQGGIDIGKDLEVERNEVVQNGKFGTRVFSSVPFLRGVSPAQRVLRGENPDTVFAAQENWKRINKINDDGSRKARKGKYITNPNVVKSDNTRVAPILNNTPKSKEIRQGDFIYTPKQLVVDDEKGFAWQPASRQVSQVPLERIYPEFDALMLGRAIGTSLSKDMQLKRVIDTSFENNKGINKNISPKVIKYSPKTNNENLKNIFDIKNDIDFYNAANEFANKYGYETFDKTLVGNRKALEDAVKQMLSRHNTFYRGVVGDDATKRIAIDTPWKEGEGIWITPQADYAQLYGQVGKLQRPYKLSSNRNNWFKDADFDYTFADDNVGLINPWQRNPKLYENTIIDKSVPHEIYAKDKLNFVDWVKDIKNAKGSNNIMNYKKFGGRKAALGLSLFRPNSFKVQELPIDNFLANSINKEIETPEVPTYVLKDDEKPVGKKVNPNIIGGGRLYNSYAVDNHEGENVNGIGGGRVYTARPIDEFATDSVSFGDIKSPRGFREQDADYIYDYLSKHSDLTDTAKAAILATAAFESGMNHKARNKYSTAKGYFQWLNDRYIPTPGLNDEQERIAQLNKIIDDMTPVKGKAKGWTQTKTRNIFDLANEFRTTDDIDRAVEIITRHHIRPSLGEEPRKNKQGVEVDKGYKWEIAERRKVARQFYNRMFNRKNKKEFGGMKLNIFKLGGLSRSKDYGSKDKPYPSVDKNDFAGGGRSYPIPTRADAVDALRLAGLHHRSDVRAKVYAKYPDLRKKAFGGPDLYNVVKKGDTLSKIAKRNGISLPYLIYANPQITNPDLIQVGDTIDFVVPKYRYIMSNKVYKDGHPEIEYYNSRYPDKTRKGHLFDDYDVNTTRFVDPNDPRYEDERFNYKAGGLRNKAKLGKYAKITGSPTNEQPSEPVRTNYVEKNNSSSNLGETIGQGIVGSLIGGSTIFGLNKLAKNYTPSLSKNNRFVSPNYDVVENPTNLERKYNYPKRVANRIKNSGVEELWDKRRLEDATKRVNNILDKYGDKIKIVNEPVAKEISSTQVYDVAKPKKYTPNLSEFSPVIKAGVQNVNRQNLNLARRLGTNIRNIGGILGKTLPGVALVDFVRNLFPSKQQEQEADKAWRRYKSPTGRIPEDYQMKFGGSKKAPYGDYVTKRDDSENIIDYVRKRRWRLPFEEDEQTAINRAWDKVLQYIDENPNPGDLAVNQYEEHPLFRGFYHRENRPMYLTNPLVSRFYNYGWSHNAGAEVPYLINSANVNNVSNTSTPVQTSTSKQVAKTAARKNNIPTVSTAAQRILDNAEIAPYQNFSHPTLAEVAGRYPISERVGSSASVTPISSPTGVQPNPADVEAVRSGNFKAIDNDRYVPIHTTTEDWVGLGANLLGSIGSYLGTRAMLNRYPMPSKPVPAIAQKLKTRFNINSALDQIREQAGTLSRMVDNNTASSRVAQARKQGISNNTTASTNQQYNQKENIETQLINQDIMNRQRVGLYNNQVYNNWLDNLFNTRRYVAEGKIGNFNNVLSNTNQAFQDLFGRIEGRNAIGRNLIFMQAAYPNVNWRNIFQNNRELARSFGFRFLNN